eukprot:TRINITY_DN26010_c0_g1_i1.p1 TRINITY_DN26010_c0_g1~~TRINITY_DN26010_c0_g1_i1.p1  ORF type:complete len:216 (-),score=-15.29 TRINITY_DN26010_c0_g1_i1:63-710(-)
MPSHPKSGHCSLALLFFFFLLKQNYIYTQQYLVCQKPKNILQIHANLIKKASTKVKKVFGYQFVKNIKIITTVGYCFLTKVNTTNHGVQLSTPLAARVTTDSNVIKIQTMVIKFHANVTEIGSSYFLQQWQQQSSYKQAPNPSVMAVYKQIIFSIIYTINKPLKLLTRSQYIQIQIQREIILFQGTVINDLYTLVIVKEQVDHNDQNLYIYVILK